MDVAMMVVENLQTPSLYTPYGIKGEPGRILRPAILSAAIQ
jgi:hypothetical protein